MIRILFLILGSPICGASALAQDRQPESPDSIESYKIESEIDHKKVVTWIHIFPRPPLKREVIPQIKDLKLDHVAMVGEEISPRLKELESEIQTKTEVPIVEVKAQKGFFKRLQETWTISFKSEELKPRPADYRYGLISTTAETASIAAMVFTEPGASIYLASAVVAVNTLFSYVNNVHNNAMNHFLSSSVEKVGKRVVNQVYFARSIAYDFITSQLIKLVQSPAALLTAETQSTIFLYTLFSTTGEILISNSNYLSYKNDPTKLAKMNFYTFAFSNILGGVELIRADWVPTLTTIGAYEFSLSTAVLIGYYAAMTYFIKSKPESVFALFQNFEDRMKKIGNWISGRIIDCKRILRRNGQNEETARLEPVGRNLGFEYTLHNIAIPPNHFNRHPHQQGLFLQVT